MTSPDADLVRPYLEYAPSKIREAFQRLTQAPSKVTAPVLLEDIKYWLTGIIDEGKPVTGLQQLLLRVEDALAENVG